MESNMIYRGRESIFNKCQVALPVDVVDDRRGKARIG